MFKFPCGSATLFFDNRNLVTSFRPPSLFACFCRKARRATPQELILRLKRMEEFVAAFAFVPSVVWKMDCEVYGTLSLNISNQNMINMPNPLKLLVLATMVSRGSDVFYGFFFFTIYDAGRVATCRSCKDGMWVTVMPAYAI